MSKITYLSENKEVSMGDEWFNVAHLKHFWIERRFNIFKKLTSKLDFDSTKIGEIGCGMGLFQKQFENHYGNLVDGIELNENYLKSSIANNHPLFCYNIHDKNNNLKEKYDHLVLFDVIEHIEDDNSFIKSALFHLKKNGFLIINVPAINSLFSKYDTAVGHIRRYSIKELEKLGLTNNCKVYRSTYWGLPLVPLLFMRKYLLVSGKYKKYNNNEIIQLGLKAPNPFIDKILRQICKVEPISQRFIGASLMTIFQKL